jgi:hypothetical protein
MLAREVPLAENEVFNVRKVIQPVVVLQLIAIPYWICRFLFKICFIH